MSIESSPSRPPDGMEPLGAAGARLCPPLLTMESRKAALAAILRLAFPAVVQQILSSLLQYVDTAMVGHLGEAATAAVSTSTTVNWLIHAVPYGFSLGLLSLLSRAYGRGDRKEMGQLSGLALRLSLWIGLGLTAICLAVSPFLPVWMHADPAVRGEASAYFFIVSLPLAFSVAGIFFSSAMNAVKDTRTPMIINSSANLLNVGLNYLLIYRCSMGVRGAAYATAVSTALGGIGLFAAFLRKEELRFQREDLREGLSRMGDLMKIAVPVVGSSVVSCTGYMVFAGMVNSMGITVFAAHSIAVTAEEIFYIPGYGIRTATSALIGIAIGEGNQQRFRDTRSISVALTMVLMCFSGVVLFFVARPLMGIFTSSEEVVALGAQVLRLVAFSEPFFGLMVAWEGINYGTGHTRSVFFIESASMWGVRILCTALVIGAGGDLQAVWYCMIADNVTKAVALTIHGLRRKEDALGGKI